MTDIKRVIAYSTMSQIGYMIMGVSVGRLRGRPVPPDDARVLQGAAVHGGRLDHRRDGRRAVARHAWAASARRCRSRSAASSSAGWRCRACRRSRASSPRTRSCSFIGRARRLALGAVRRRLHRRVPDRDLHVPDDLPRLLRRAVPGGARARGTATCTTPRCPPTRATGEEEDTDVGFPGPDAPHRRARAADEGRDGHRWRSARSSPACADPERRLRDRRLPASRASRTPSTSASAPRERPAGLRARARRRARRCSASRSPTASGCSGPGTPARDPRSACARRTSCSSTSGTSTSSIDALVVRPLACVRALRAADVRARVRRRDAGRRHDRRRARRLGRRARRCRAASCATTRRCSCSASPASASTSCSRAGGAADAPLDPALAARSPSACSARSLARARSRAASRSRGALGHARRSRSSLHSLAFDRARRRGLQFVTDVRGSPQLGHPLQARARRAERVPRRARRRCCSRPAMLARQPARVGAPARSSTSTSCSPSPPCSAPSARRTSRCSSPSST